MLYRYITLIDPSSRTYHKEHNTPLSTEDWKYISRVLWGSNYSIVYHNNSNTSLSENVTDRVKRWGLLTDYYAFNFLFQYHEQFKKEFGVLTQPVSSL